MKRSTPRQSRQGRIEALREIMRTGGGRSGIAPASLAEIAGVGVPVERMEGGNAIVGGVATEVFSARDASRADVLVCMPWEGQHHVPGNLRGTCLLCGRAIRYSPAAPRKPEKVCFQCVAEAVSEGRPPKSIFG